MRKALVVPLAALLLGAALVAPGRAEPPTPLPNLFAYPPSFLVGPVTGELYEEDPTSLGPVIDGCLIEERAEGAERCLRYSTKVVNFDLEPLRLVLRAEPTGTNAYQEVRGDLLPAGTFSLDAARGEVQLDDFYVVRMWRFDGRKRVGRPVASTGLRGLCPGERPYVSLRQTCGLRTENGRGPVIRLPWLERARYTSDVPGQYLEISGVPDGLYVLEIEIDPKDHIRESHEGDNRSCVVIRLEAKLIYEGRDGHCWPRRT